MTMKANDRTWSITAALMVFVAITVFATTSWAVVRYANKVPYWDQWGTVAEVNRLWSGEYTIADLFRQHNEHRIAVSRLIFYLDYLLFGGRNILNNSAIILLQLAQAALLFWLYRRSSPSSTTNQSVAVFALMTTMLFSLSQYENFLWGFQITFVGVYAAATGSLACMVRASFRRDRPVSMPWVAAAILLAVAATFSMANGMLIWALLAGYTIYHQLGRVILGILLMVATVVIGGYILDFQYPQNHSAPIIALHYPFFYLIYVLTYIGNSIGNPGAVLGLVGSAMLVLSLVVAIRFRPLAPSQTALIAVSLFVFGAAMLTGVGRLKFGFGQATGSRYLTPSTIFWVAQFAFWMSLITADGIRRRGAVVALFATVAVTAALLTSHLTSFPVSRDRMLRLAVASDALILGVRDGEVLRRLYPDEEVVLARRKFLKQQSFSVFAEPVVADLGSPVTQAFRRAAIGRCEGNMSAAVPVSAVSDEGWQLSGWSRDISGGGAPQRIVIADSRGLVTGLASVGHPRDAEPGIGSEAADAGTGWIGYAKSAYPPFTAYALLDDGATVCALSCVSTGLSGCAGPR